MARQDPGALAFRDTLDSVFAGPAYRWGEVPAPLRLLREGWDRLGEWLVGLRADNPLAYRLLVLGLLLALLLILAHAGYVVWRTARAAARDDQRLPRRDAGEHRDAAWYSRAADRAAEAGRLLEALQLAFVALTLTLHEQGAVQYHASKTPAEYAGRSPSTITAGGAPPARPPGMRPRAELALGAALLVLLGVGAAALGSRRARVIDTDERRSTYLAGPGGARGFADALDRLGVEVMRHRRSVEWLDSLAGDSGSVVVLLQPSVRVSAAEGRHLAEMDADLLLAGSATDPVTSCLGYRVWPRSEPASVVAPPGAVGAFPPVRAELVRHLAGSVTDSSARADAGDITCTIPEPAQVDTLLQARGGRVVALALRYGSGRRVTLVADGVLFSNRALRETAAGPFALGLVIPRYQRALVDERHHGYEIAGSLAGAAIDWSLRSPWGWAIWQLAVVGVLALLAAGIRFGPARSVIVRRRRSPLEHVRALATALAAARGHDIAARLMVQGLRRRLSRSGRPVGGDVDAWLDGLGPSLRTPRGQAALIELTDLTRRRTSTEGVLRAAHAVETLWEELKPR